LIDNILNSSRLIEDGAGIYFRTAKIDLTALLCEVCELHREITPERQFVERFDTAPLYTVGDSKLLFQVFSNLLANAVKYSPGAAPSISAPMFCRNSS
jgi:two-component system, OmpR family, sensor kinase